MLLAAKDFFFSNSKEEGAVEVGLIGSLFKCPTSLAEVFNGFVVSAYCQSQMTMII